MGRNSSYTMIIQVLCILTATPLFSYISCDNDGKSETASISWKLPLSRERIVTKIGKQMPPHEEPDAILVNPRRNGQPQIPEGNFPGYPGGPTIFGFPRSGVNMPGGYGAHGVFGTPRMPAYPNPFGIPGGHVFVTQPGMQGVPGIPNDPSVFMIPGQGGPQMHNGPNVYSVQAGQNGPGFIVRTGYFGLNGENLQPGEPRIFGQPGVFAMAGSGNIPFSVLPEFFLPGRGSNVPQAAGRFPFKGTLPETFEPNPGKTNGFRPLIPNRPDYNSDGSFPRHEFYGGAGGREVYDDPIANPFPLVETSPLFFEVPS